MNITLPRAVIEQALEALERPTYDDFLEWASALKNARDALRTALGQQYMTNAEGELEPVTVVQTGVGIGNPEPVAWMLKTGHGTQFKEKLTDELKALTWNGKPMWVPLYDSPPQRKPLTEEEIKTYRHMIDWTAEWSYINFARAIEAAHGIKGDA